MKAIFFDVDGTLIEGTNPDFRHITETVQKAIRKLQAAGHYVFIASGRSLAFLDENMRSFGFDGYVLLNGSVVFFHDKLIYSDPIDRSIIVNLCKVCDEHNMQYSLHDEDSSYVKKEFKYLINRLEDYGIHERQLCTEYDLKDKPKNLYKIEVDSPNYSDREYIIAKLPNELKFTEDRSYDYCHMEVYAKKNSKASGILKVLEILNIDVKDSYAFGDGDNDVEMLSTVGLGMAMGNASPKAKAAAKLVVPSVLENGIAYGIENYILDK